MLETVSNCSSIKKSNGLFVFSKVNLNKLNIYSYNIKALSFKDCDDKVLLSKTTKLSPILIVIIVQITFQKRIFKNII